MAEFIIKIFNIYIKIIFIIKNVSEIAKNNGSGDSDFQLMHASWLAEIS